jgi:hypothetical protein
MSDFRRFILRIVDVLGVLSIFGGAFLFALLGYALGETTGRISGSVGLGPIYFVLGGVIGFIIFAIPAALMFSLSEIAANTRETLLAVRQSKIGSEGHQIQIAHANQAIADAVPFIDITKELSKEAVEVIRLAKEAGYEVAVSQDRKSVTIRRGRLGASYASNAEILDFGRVKGLIK